MIALICFVLAVLASPFKWKSRLEAENAALRHQLIVLRRKMPGRPGSRTTIFRRRTGDAGEVLSGSGVFAPPVIVGNSIRLVSEVELGDALG